MPVPFSLDTAPLVPIPRAGERAMILAPHPDDETLGAGGWIYSARQQGAEVRIVFLTDGDAFRLAAMTSAQRFPTQSVCRELGERRQAEATAAAAALGVRSDSLRFLGFPDRGLAALQIRSLGEPPFRSWTTGRNQTGERSQRPGRPFCGTALLEDLIVELESFRPEHFLFPDPKDDHRDHRASAWFAGEALFRLADAMRPKWVRCYLIHQGLWPNPHRLVDGELLSPPASILRDYRGWETLPLNRAAVNAKAAALREHASQHLWASDLFGAHLRKNELFTRMPQYGRRDHPSKRRTFRAPSLR